MTGEERARLGMVRVEVLGHADYMEPEQLSVLEKLPNYLLAENVDSDLYYREPGGMGLLPLVTADKVDHQFTHPSIEG